MRDGFGGTVAVPAWAAFMTAATRGAKPEWYRMPADVEKVKICRLSGMRAGPHCEQDAFDPSRIGEPVVVNASDAAEAPEPNVYEDLFTIGAIPSELCPLHEPGPRSLDGASPPPGADSLVQPASYTPVAATGAAIRTPQTRLYVERVPQADGSFKTTIRQR
jgi:hypothetical protein